MTDRALLQQALEALELLSRLPTDNALDYADNAITALRERLAQPEQEPVAHVYLFDPNGRPRVAWDNAKDIKIGDKLYTTPPQRKKLPPQTPCLLTQAENKMTRIPKGSRNDFQRARQGTGLV